MESTEIYRPQCGNFKIFYLSDFTWNQVWYFSGPQNYYLNHFRSSEFWVLGKSSFQIFKCEILQKICFTLSNPSNVVSRKIWVAVEISYLYNVQRLKIQNSNLTQKILRQINQFAIIMRVKLRKFYTVSNTEFISYPRQSWHCQRYTTLILVWVFLHQGIN